MPPLAAGVHLHKVRIELDPDTRFVTTLTLQHVSGGFNPNAKGCRLGCAFSELEVRRSARYSATSTRRKSASG